MIAFIWKAILGGAWKPIAWALGALGLYVKVTSDAKAKVEGKQAKAGLDATTKGNAAARKGKAEAAEKLKQGKTREQIVRGNDDAWR